MKDSFQYFILSIIASCFFACNHTDDYREGSKPYSESEILTAIVPQLILSNLDDNWNTIAYMDTSIYGTRWEEGNLRRGIFDVIDEHSLRDIKALINADSTLLPEADSVFSEFNSKLTKPIKFTLISHDSIRFIAYPDSLYNPNEYNAYQTSDSLFETQRKNFIAHNYITHIYRFSRIAFNKNKSTGVFYYESDEKGSAVTIQYEKNKWKVKAIRLIWIS